MLASRSDYCVSWALVSPIDTDSYIFNYGIKNYYSNKEVTIDYINVNIKDKPSLNKIIEFIA